MGFPDYSNKVFLLVEDDEQSALFIKDLLEETGATILHSSNASDAIMIAHQNKAIDLVLMDIQLPDMNGWQATRILKKVKKTMPIIIQSAFAMESYIKKSQEAGCDYFISKPIDIDILFEKIELAFSKNEILP
jgi:two-component system cell cycle response regulator DivK